MSNCSEARRKTAVNFVAASRASRCSFCARSQCLHTCAPRASRMCFESSRLCASESVIDTCAQEVGQSLCVSSASFSPSTQWHSCLRSFLRGVCASDSSEQQLIRTVFRFSMRSCNLSLNLLPVFSLVVHLCRFPLRANLRNPARKVDWTDHRQLRNSYPPQ